MHDPLYIMHDAQCMIDDTLCIRHDASFIMHRNLIDKLEYYLEVDNIWNTCIMHSLLNDALSEMHDA